MLTNLIEVKAWLGITSTGDDALLRRLISTVSRAILSYLNRDALTWQSYTEYPTGVGVQLRQQLRNWPVTGITQVLINGITVAASALPSANNSAQPGYRVETWDNKLPGRLATVSLFGYTWSTIPQGNLITYSAGYRRLEESHAIPNSGPYEVTTDLPWAENVSVTLGGTALTEVTGTPATGEYRAPSEGTATYLFNSAQAGQTVLITYSFTPPDVQLAAFMMIGELYRYKDRIGQVSRSLAAQETTAYDRVRMTDDIKLLLNPYRSVVPL